MSKGYGAMEEEAGDGSPPNNEPEFKQVVSAVCNEAEMLKCANDLIHSRY